MTTLYDHIKILYDEQLYSNIIALAPLVITISDNNFVEYVTPNETYQTYCYYADALYYTKQYRKAETIYRKALQLRKSLLKSRGSAKLNDSSKEIHSEVDLKYKMHLCYLEMNQPRESIDILQSIPMRQRTAKIHIGLGKVLEFGRAPKQAITAYKEALKMCPLALEAAERLLALKVPATIVMDLMASGTYKSVQEAPKETRQKIFGNISDTPMWNTAGVIAGWISSMAHVKSGNWPYAAQSLRALDSVNAPLRGCSSVLVTLGEVYYHAGEYKQAIAAFQRAHTIDPHMVRGLDAYAACLSRENRLRDRADILVPPSLPPSEYTPHHWLTLAHLHVDRRRLPPAAYLAQKACYADPRNPEALILKGNILMSMKKYTEAIEHFLEAMDIAPDRFECYSGLAEANMALRRTRQALTVCLDCCKKFNQSPRSLTLYANMILKEGDSEATSKARDLLEKALMLDNRHLPAALALARLVDAEEGSQSTLELLEKLVAAYPSSVLHQALGEAWARRGGVTGAEHAVQHYASALVLEPGSRRALDALSRLDRTPTTQQGQPSGSATANTEQAVEEADNTYELIAEANVPSDNSNAPEESETEAVSDMDLELP